MSAHIVPWYNCDEWHKVFDLIYSETPDKDEALGLLLVWKARCPSLPSGIESTLTLLQVCVQDRANNQDENEQVLRLAYSSAIMRFVNHTLDTETAKGSSLYKAAKNLGVADWIVEMRHDTAHSNNLPSLMLLREAARLGLEWLQTNYWEKHKPLMQDYLSAKKYTNIKDQNKIAVLMNFCISLSFCSHSKCKIRNLAQIPNPSMRESIIADAKELLGANIDENLKKVSISSLVSKINAQSKRLLRCKDVVSHVNEALLGEDNLFLSIELANSLCGNEFQSKKTLSKVYIQCFEVLLTYLHTNDLLVDFLLALIEVTQCNENYRLAQLAALWVSQILIALKKSKDFMEKIQKVHTEDMVGKKRKDLKLLYYHWFPNDKTCCLLLDLLKPVPPQLLNITFIQPIISSYNPNLTYFVKDLLNLVEPPMPTLVVQKICGLAKLIAYRKHYSTTSSRIYTVDDIKSAEDTIDLTDHVEMDQSDDVVEISEDNHGLIDCILWQLASKTHNWSTCPIGKLPWQQNSDVEMET